MHATSRIRHSDQIRAHFLSSDRFPAEASLFLRQQNGDGHVRSYSITSYVRQQVRPSFLVKANTALATGDCLRVIQKARNVEKFLKNKQLLTSM